MEENNVTEEQIEQPDENLNEELSDQMILFPKATILRLARKNYPKLQINKDAQEALQHSASLFMSYIYTLARISSVKNSRKTITLEEIMEALETNGLDSLDLHQETLELLQLYTKNENKKKEMMK
jgi:histone H3/H4